MNAAAKRAERIVELARVALADIGWDGATVRRRRGTVEVSGLIARKAGRLAMMHIEGPTALTTCDGCYFCPDDCVKVPVGDALRERLCERAAS